MLISDSYATLNRHMHKASSSYGIGGWRWAKEIEKIHEEIGGGSILDYGCGKGTLAAKLSDFAIQEYDPAIPGKNKDPERSDLVVCTDVLEHIEPQFLDDVLEHLRVLTVKRLFLHIACKPAIKLLPDGSNPHRIIKTSEWWENKISEKFKIINMRKTDNYVVIDAVSLARIEILNTFPALTDEQRNNNVASNSAKIKERLNDNQPLHKRTAVLVCYGPSLVDTWESITWDSHQHDIVTVSGSHQFLIERDLIPDIHIDSDPRRRKAEQFGYPHKAVKYWMASCVDPYYLEILNGCNVTLWHNHNGYESERFTWELEPDAWLLVGGGSVGLRAVSLLYSQGYRNFEIHGMDCSFRGTKEQNEQHAGPHLAPKPKAMMEVVCNGRKFISNPSFIDYARQFLDDQRLWPGARFVFHGDGLLQEMVRVAANQQEKAA